MIASHIKKNKRRLKWWTKFKYTKTVGVSGALSGVIDTQIFFMPTHLPVGRKCHSLTLNTKLRLQLTIGTPLVQDYTSHDKEFCLQGIRLKNYF